MGAEALITILVPALLPALTDGMKGLFQKFFGGTKPINVDEQIRLMEAEVRRLEALAKLDAPANNVSQWVADLRGSFRYIAAGAIIIGTLALVAVFFFFNYTDPENRALPTLVPIIDMFSQMAGSVFAFMFGDRMYFNLTQGYQKIAKK